MRPATSYLITVVAIFLTIMSAGDAVSAQGYIEPVDALQLALDYIGPGLETALPPAVDWEMQSWLPMGLVGSSVSGFVFESWVARVSAPVVPEPVYNIVLTDLEEPGIWIGQVTPEGDVDGEWLNVEENLEGALEEYLAGRGFEVEDDSEWLRLPLYFDIGAAASAGYFPSLVTVLYVNFDMNVVAVLWYDIEPPYNVMLQTVNGVTWLRFSDYEKPDLMPFGNEEETDELMKIEAVQMSPLEDERLEGAIAFRFFADFSNSCALPGPFYIDGADAVIGLRIREGNDCFEQYRFFEIVIVGPDTLESVNGMALEDLLVEGTPPVTPR